MFFTGIHAEKFSISDTIRPLKRFSRMKPFDSEIMLSENF